MFLIIIYLAQFINEIKYDYSQADYYYLCETSSPMFHHWLAWNVKVTKNLLYFHGGLIDSCIAWKIIFNPTVKSHFNRI